MLQFQENTASGDWERIASLAAEIWTEHYTPLIGAEQVRYMLDRFQSAEAIRLQVADEGYRYFTVGENGDFFGYCALKQEDDGTLFLSKFYIAKSFRGRGAGRSLLRFALSRFAPAPTAQVWLTVNKHNAASLAAYDKLGFSVVGEIVADIGNGFCMDDYRLESVVSELFEQ